MIWIIVIGIVGYIAYRFLSDLNKDKADLRDKNASEKFSIVAGFINEAAFNNNGEITVIDNCEFTLYEGKNQMVRFIYSTGNLTIIWSYKYFQKEVVHQKVYRDVRNLSIFEQEKIARNMVSEMSHVIEQHQIKVIEPVLDDITNNVDLDELSNLDENEEENEIGGLGIEDTGKKIRYEATFVDFSISDESSEYYLSQGDRKYNLGDYYGAISDFDKAIEIEPNNVDAYTHRGYSKNLIENYKEAIDDFSKVIEIDPSDSIAYYNRGSAKSEMGDYRGAIADYSKSIEFDKDGLLIDSIYTDRGKAKTKIKDYHSAISDYNKSIEIDPENTYAYILRSRAKSEISDYQGSIIDCDMVININSDNALAYYTRGIAKCKSGQKKSGCIDLTKAGELGITEASDAIKEYCN